uniref:Calponin-homology (CH) domain-containing protein n=1 Tax=Electrophorus electricus TaxID=8005 RepID=A0A4W4EPB2_ELEEL
MSDILCRWLNAEVGLSKVVEPHSFPKDFANGYLIGEVLSRYQLQDDFAHFSNGANAKLNNFTRLEPTLQLLGVPFDLGMAKAVMQGQQGAATRLLYQLYVLLQKKKRAGLTGATLETMQPVATAKLHRLENRIFTERLRTITKRDADLKIQKITQRFDRRRRDIRDRSVMAELVQEEKHRHLQEEMRLKDIEKHRQTHRKHQEMMDRIQLAVVQVPKPPASRSLRTLEQQQQQEAQVSTHLHIAQFEKNRKRLSPAYCDHAEQMSQWNTEFMQRIRRRVEEDGAARMQREQRRHRALQQQLHTHHTHQEMLREEQLVGRLMRQSQQEKRIAVRLMQIRQQKEVLRQNRILRESQYQEQRLRDFQQALDREAALLLQVRIEQQEQSRKEQELHAQLVAECTHNRHRKHFNTCRGIVEQIVDLATKAGEYRLLTANLIPGKVMREWKELWFRGQPLYAVSEVEGAGGEASPEQAILNAQDYEEYTSMTGEWAWPEEVECKAPPSSSDILGHIVTRLRNMVNPPEPSDPPPAFPHFTLRACVLGKPFTGKTRCLRRITEVHGIYVLSADRLIQEALEAHQAGDKQNEVCWSCVLELLCMTLPYVLQKSAERCGSPLQDAEQGEAKCTLSAPDSKESPSAPSLSLQAQYGAGVEKALRSGRAVPNELLIDIFTDAIRQVPSGQGWVLDGFPVDISQARLLEKALGGADPDQANKKGWGRTHNLAEDRRAPKAPPPPSPVLDLVVLLDLTDEQVMDRATQSNRESTNIDHEITATADHSSGSQENAATPRHTQLRVAPAGEQSLEQRQIQHRYGISGDTWPKLEKWFGEKQRILVKVTAEVDEDTLFSNVENVLFKNMVAAEQGLSNACSSYVSNVKTVMQNLRNERNLITHHLYNIREDFRHYLQRPDLKQDFVCVWQRDYNSLPDDIRQDEETKAELHQRLDDLKERLWDICDKRKEEAMQERAGVLRDGWLEDHTAVLLNHYSALLQAEVDRFQDTMHVFRDYYSGMYSSVLPEATPDFTCIPLLDIVVDDNGNHTDTTKRQALAEVQRLESEGHVEVQQQLERERAGRQSLASATDPSSAKDKKKAGRKKGRTQAACLVSTQGAVKQRLELVLLQALATVRSLQHGAELIHSTMEEWLGARYLAEMHSIDQLAKVVQHHIERGVQIPHELVLVRADFFLDGDIRVVASPPPLLRPPPVERSNHSTLTVLQLHKLHSQLCKIAPTGYKKYWSFLTLCEVLNMGSDALPEAWVHLTDSQIHELVCGFAQDCETVDWRQFLVGVAQPWPLPSQNQLIKTLKRFRAIDTAGDGVITLEQYLQVELWFASESDLPVPEDLTEPLPYDRMANLREFFFVLFADPASPPAVCDYMNMLLYFCCHPDPAQGFTRALSLVTQHTLTYTHSRSLIQSMAHLDSECDVEEECGCVDDEGCVSIDELLTVLRHGGAWRRSSQHRLHPSRRRIEELQQVFKEFGFKEEEKIPFSVLSQHPFLQDLMESSSQYLLTDIHRVLLSQQSEGESTAA